MARNSWPIVAASVALATAEMVAAVGPRSFGSCSRNTLNSSTSQFFENDDSAACADSASASPYHAGAAPCSSSSSPPWPGDACGAPYSSSSSSAGVPLGVPNGSPGPSSSEWPVDLSTRRTCAQAQIQFEIQSQIRICIRFF
eukprot:157927-Chlamydomonas_euryale.AAC.2